MTNLVPKDDPDDLLAEVLERAELERFRGSECQVDGMTKATASRQINERMPKPTPKTSLASTRAGGGVDLLSGQKRRHRKAQGIGDGPKQLTFADGHLAVVRDARDEGAHQLLLELR